MSARKLSIVSKSTLRGVAGVGGTGSALATGGAALVAALALALALAGVAPEAVAAGAAG
jgi:hypothetical protein